MSSRTSASNLTRFRSVKRLLIVLSLVFSILALPLPSAASQPAVKASQPSKLERQVTEWVAKLAEQKPFQAWSSADPQIEALGPGTHSWLVLFTKEGKHIGYMVVHAVTDGSFRLGEYGVGPYTLFSPILLKRSLIDNGLLPADQVELMTAIKHYAHPFAAAWEVTIGDEVYWLDAKTAEILPVDGAYWKQAFPNEALSSSSPSPLGDPEDSAKVSKQRVNEPFDAYERLPWLTKEASFSTKDASKLQRRIDYKQHLRYVIEPFGDSMLYAVPVIGYQSWTNGRMDVAVDMQGTRFIPLEELRKLGLFYR
jgi:hypothetical protein